MKKGAGGVAPAGIDVSYAMRNERLCAAQLGLLEPNRAGPSPPESGALIFASFTAAHVIGRGP